MNDFIFDAALIADALSHETGIAPGVGQLAAEMNIKVFFHIVPTRGTRKKRPPEDFPVVF